jgi:hypothetical protein
MEENRWSPGGGGTLLAPQGTAKIRLCTPPAIVQRRRPKALRASVPRRLCTKIVETLLSIILAACLPLILLMKYAPKGKGGPGAMAH